MPTSAEPPGQPEPGSPAGAAPGSPLPAASSTVAPPPAPPPARPPAYLACHELVSGYRKVPVVRGVSLQVALGEIVLVIGPNGAGKSTLAKALTGQLPCFEGSVTLGGEEISRLAEEVRSARGIGYVPQVNDVFATMTVTENLEMGGYRVPARALKARIDEIFDLFPTLQVMRRRQARTLSGGERKTLGIARALVPQPKALILDEPTSNLAPLIAARVLHEVAGALAASGHAVLAIEQRVSLGLEVAHWGYVLTEGTVRLDASAEALRSHADLGALFLAAQPAPAPAAPAPA